MSGEVRILIADRPLMRLAVRIGLEGKVDICAEAGDAEQAIRAAKKQQPDVCLVGRELAGGGLAAVRGICRAAPAARAIMLADVGDVDDMLEAIRCGAVGYVPGNLSGEHLLRIINAVLTHEAALPRSMVLDLLLELRSGGTDGLTWRESQVLGMLRRGHSTATIAKRLEIAPVTVRRHVSELVRKLGVEDRAALVDAAA